MIIKGKTIKKGIVEGEALVATEAIGFCSGIDPSTGMITELNHPNQGEVFSGKILVMPSAKGSSAFTKASYACYLAGKAPIGILVNEVNPQIAMGAIVMRAPAISNFDTNPIEHIKTGDWVKMDADRGIVEIVSKS